jgi:hypothetical protein
MTPRSLALLAACVLFARSAAAADLEVRYSVEEKPLKAAVSGTQLTFALYTDDACADLAQSFVVNVENVSLLSKLKQMTPKNDTKLPNTVELRTALAGVTAGGNLHLRVTGTGVTPVGGACQAQAAHLAAVVRDTNGAFVSSFPRTLRTIAGDVVELPISAGGILPSDPLVLYHASSDCSGAPLLFIDPSLIKSSQYDSATTTVYYPPSSAAFTLLGSRSEYSVMYFSPANCPGGTFVATGHCCFPQGGGGPYGTALTWSASGLAAPFHVEGQP